MANFEVNVNHVIRVSNELSELGNQIGSKFYEAFNILMDLGNTQKWIGKQYDNVIIAVNQSLDRINNLIKKASYSIPELLYVVAKNYADKDGTILTTASNFTAFSPIDIYVLPTYIEGTIKYDDSSVDSAREQFGKTLTTISSMISYYQNSFNSVTSISWMGEAKDKFGIFVDQFSTTASDTLNEIQLTINQSVNDAQIALNEAESTNMNVSIN